MVTLQQQEDNTTPAYIVDIDGCLADSELRNLFQKEIQEGDYTWFEQRLPYFKANKEFVRIINALSNTNTIIFVTARSQKYWGETMAWLRRNITISLPIIYMRPNNDMREDYMVKRDLYRKYIKGKFNVIAALDDNQGCIDMWQSEWISTFHFKSIKKSVHRERL